ncbi:50S ribosomal protein L11 methyltransferase [Desulfopila inferna]|uniref:50S ribosomal protein L11 methyltransferase n=1 Tax=Desulfopila inferna TaxID=468528 RepID=UPI0019648505|nr:50S ribosomal protein L11 methyltransferase [Desulfopila inferna]MBM9604028.1 50S ribosomal protein L11 methyltransferase [Desulfopila inferna]
MKRWLKLSFITEPVLVDSIADFLIGIVGAGVEIGIDEDIYLKSLNAYVEKENPSQDELEEVLRLVADHTLELAEIFQVNPPELSWTIIEEEDWGKNWKKHFLPFAVTDGLVIAPSWENYQPKPGEEVLVMDPGMAFGTGHHATTALALQMLKEVMAQPNGPRSVLDVGTGTGILGMAAALLGAEKVLGIDNDPIAVAAAAENIEKNALGAVMAVRETPLAQLEEESSLVIANIVYDVLEWMSADLYRLTIKDGLVILSGILQERQAKSLIDVYEDLGFSLQKRKDRDEWAALLLKKVR